ncbi:hypothetical protein TVAG_188660 [Trichomonas vaginalis G3]|uniref:Uncharacterized protein n=1 Tax=Trichomonas vaginalis (strain ATCC PRA-98 / G3) TaxID=412133 RepID=A2EEY1_TRIV3|nr:hypothetical protein TVAGG3_0471950 [Trichomonas vaginalis G3]EAY08779.1 hypothetical protein TVAG_188660 [Trichomonas vaginalis G3]KAI5515125.1 hypothetical protein TVAGG3_0471950 [Trichomonas vaginalis G3]|eukprot:XP_001321002.1 hypothetical protein [Trichomonas vaginalis G3]
MLHKSYFGVYFKQYESTNQIPKPDGYQPGIFHSLDIGGSIKGEYTGLKYYQFNIPNLGEFTEVALAPPGIYFSSLIEKSYLLYLSDTQGLKDNGTDISNFVFVGTGKGLTYDGPNKTIEIVSFAADGCRYLSILYNAGGYSYWSRTNIPSSSFCLISFQHFSHTITVSTDDGNVYPTQRFNSRNKYENRYYGETSYTTEYVIDNNILWRGYDPKKYKIGVISVNTEKVTSETPKIFSVPELPPLVETGSCIGCTPTILQSDDVYTANTDKVYLDISTSSRVFISDTMSFVHFNWFHPLKVISKLEKLYLESADGMPHPIKIVSNPGIVWQNSIEKQFILKDKPVSLMFDESVTLKIEIYEPDLQSYSNLEVNINGNPQIIEQGSTTLTDVTFFSMVRSNHHISFTATPNDQNSFYNILRRGLYGTSEGNYFANDKNIFKSDLGFNSLYIPPDQQVTIIRPEAGKLYYLILNKEEFFDENNQKIDSQIENLDHDIIIKSSDHVRVLEFAMIDITDVQQYIIIYNTINNNITIDHRSFDYSITNLSIFYLQGPFEKDYIMISSLDPVDLQNCGFRLKKIVLNPSILDIRYYLCITKENSDELGFIQTQLSENNMITEKVITNIEKDIYYYSYKLTVKYARNNTLEIYKDYDTDILISSNNDTVPVLIYDHDKFIDETGNKLLSTYADKKVITISKNSPIFLEDRSNYLINITCYNAVRDVDYIDFIDLSGTKIYYLNKELDSKKRSA